MRDSLGDKMQKNNPFPWSDSNKRYYTYDYYLKKRFGSKCCKIILDGGFTCPNRDGTIAHTGCIFCSPMGSGDFCADRRLTITEQFHIIRERLQKKWPGAVYLAYFQAYSNTYAPLEILKEKYEEALAQPGVVGINIATRADCIEDRILTYFCELSQETALTIELGLQSVHDETLKRIRRGHDFECFLRTYTKLKGAGIDVCIHIINGLPGETEAMMLKTAEKLADLQPHSVKFHMLNVLKGTALAETYLKEPFPLLTRDAYVNIVCRQLERLPSATVIGRVCGDAGADSVIAPYWTRKKFVVMNEIDKWFVQHASMQGRLYQTDANGARTSC